MKQTITQTCYPLVPSQESMATMLKYSIHKNVMQIPSSVTFKVKLDFSVLQKAFEEEVKRNDCLRIRFLKEKDGWKQYFLDEVKAPRVPVLRFATEEEQEAYFAADAQRTVRIFNGETFRLRFFYDCKGGSGIYLNVSHLIMDAHAVAVFYLDLIQVYKALVDGAELPEPLYSFEEQVNKDLDYLADEKKMKRDEDFYRDFWLKDGKPFHASITGHDLLDKARKKDPEERIPAAYDALHDKAAMAYKKIDPETSEKIFKFCLEQKVSPETLFELGYRAHASLGNYRTDDTFSLQLCSRRVTYKQKKMGGCMTQPLAVRAIIPGTATFAEGLKTLDGVRNTLYRHMNYPYLTSYAMERKIYNLSMFQAPSFMMYTWLPLPLIEDEALRFDFKGYNMGRYCMPLYTFTYPDVTDHGIRFNYLYRIARISPAVIDTLHDNCVKAVLLGIDNPALTMDEIMDQLVDVNTLAK